MDVKSYDEGPFLTDGPDNVYYWYSSEADALEQDSAKRINNRLTLTDATGASIQPSEMLNDDISFADDNGNRTTPANMGGSPPPGTYTYYVTQVSNKKYWRVL